MARPLVIPFFIAHQGCPHRCAFCNQQVITGCGAALPLDGARIGAEIAAQLARPRHPRRQGVQVAFYGGSFTGLPLARQRELLTAVQPFLENNEVDRIRLSTRPDYIDSTIVDFLKSFGVGIVELGVQSMDDAVLAASARGHTGREAERAVRSLQAGGLAVGVQVMVGLPGDRPGLLFRGVERLASLKPDLARIYPVVVLKGSALADDYRAGRFHPLSLARAAALSGRVKEIFEDAGVRVVRTGLQATDGLADDIVAGPYHPAFGEMVLARNLYGKVRAALTARQGKGPLELRVAAADQSVLRGPGNRNLKRLTAKGLLAGVTLVFEDNRPRGTAAVVAV